MSYLGIDQHARQITISLRDDNGVTIDNTSGSPVTLPTTNAQTWNGSGASGGFTYGGTGSLAFGAGAVTITGDAGTAYSQTITANAANAGTTLAIGGNIALAGTVTTADTLAIAGAGNVTLDGNISNGSGNGASLALTMGGAGTLTLGGTNAYGGATNIAGGNLTLSGGGVLPSTTAVNFTGTATLNVVSTSQSITNLTVADGFTGTVTGATGSLTVTGAAFQLGSSTTATNHTLGMSGLGSFAYDMDGAVLHRVGSHH